MLVTLVQLILLTMRLLVAALSFTGLAVSLVGRFAV